MESTKNLKLGVIFSYITMVAGIIVSLTYTPFLLDSLGQQQYGLYNMGQSAVSFLGLAEFGFGSAVVRYASKYRAEGNENKTAGLYGMFMRLYAFLAMIILVVGAVICILSSYIFKVETGARGYFELRMIILIMVVNLALTFATQPYHAIVQSYERFTFIKIADFIYTVLKPLVMIPLLIWGYKAIALSLVALVLQQMLNLIHVLYVHGKLHVKISFKKKDMDFSIFKEILGYSFFIFLGMIVGQLNDGTDNIILGIVSGEIAVAICSVGYQLYGYIQQIPGIVSSVFFPRVTSQITNGATMEDMTNLSIRVGRIQFFLAFLLCSGFALFGQEFIYLWVGEEYAIAYWIALALALPAVIPNIQAIPVQVLQAVNKHQFKSILYVICAVLNVATSIPAAIYFGPLGCAICTGLTTLVTKGIIINWYYKKKIGLGIGRFWANISILLLKLAPLVAVGIGINFLLPNVSWLWLFLKIGIYSVLFAVYAFCLGMNKEERGLVTGFMGGFLNKVRRKNVSPVLETNSDGEKAEDTSIFAEDTAGDNTKAECVETIVDEKENIEGLE
ncbi:MAG: lipopolysaccharide biosynthesis protein [Clostridiales bacterium]|nr:lipopolysaccharide biosynthesis protein [Clostridiales bacterium]